jgi:WD40 repeat protein
MGSSGSPSALDNRFSVKEPSGADIRSVTFNAVNRVAAACQDRSVRVYRVDTGARVATMYGHTGAVNCAVWAPNNQILATGADDGRCVECGAEWCVGVACIFTRVQRISGM